MDKRDYMKLKSFYTTKETLNRLKTHDLQKGQKICKAY